MSTPTDKTKRKLGPKRKKRYMTDESFAELRQSLTEALQHARGERDDLRTMRRPVPATPKPMSSAEIVNLRRRLNLSQSVFAMALNVSKKTVEAWEYGARTPSDAALKLLAIADKHPEVLLD